MDRQSRARLSKLLSLVLRHEPGKFSLVLDAEGFAPLDEVVRVARTQFPGITGADVIQVVETVEQDERRFSIVDGEIRANYGHSLAERIAHGAAEPPALLFHRTHESAVDIVLREGLAPMKRLVISRAGPETKRAPFFRRAPVADRLKVRITSSPSFSWRWSFSS